MNDQDKEHKRFLLGCFAMCGAIMRGESWTPKQIWDIADDMIDAEEADDTVGLPPIKSRKAKTK
jgi:hypothetical protein